MACSSAGDAETTDDALTRVSARSTFVKGASAASFTVKASISLAGPESQTRLACALDANCVPSWDWLSEICARAVRQGQFKSLRTFVSDALAMEGVSYGRALFYGEKLVAEGDGTYALSCIATDELTVLTANRGVATAAARDLAALDGKTHTLPFAVAKAMKYEESPAAAASISASADDGPAATQRLTFEPLVEPPEMRAQFAKLAPAGTLEVLEPLNYHQRSYDWLKANNQSCCDWGDTTSFEQSKRLLDTARARLQRAGYIEREHHEPGRAPAAGDGPDVARNQGGGGYSIFEKKLGAKTIVHRVVGPKGDATASLVAGWAKTAAIVLVAQEPHGYGDLSGSTGSPSHSNPELAGNPNRYRIEIEAPLFATPELAPPELTSMVVQYEPPTAEDSTVPYYQTGLYSAGRRDWLSYASATPTLLIERLASGAFAGSGPSYNEMVVTDPAITAMAEPRSR